MAPAFVISPAREEDRAAWLLLWRHYQLSVPSDVEAVTWNRIMDTREPIGCLLARREGGDTIGFLNYVLYPSTWSANLVCSLQDLFVLWPARRQGVAQLLLAELVQLGLASRWERIDIVTAENNYSALRLYDALGRRKRGARYEIPLLSRADPE